MAVVLIVTAGFLLAFALESGGPRLFAGAVLRSLWILPLWAAGGYLVYRRPASGAGGAGAQTGVPVMALLALLVLYLVSATAGAGDFYFLKWLPEPGGVLARSGLERTLLWGWIFLLLGQWKPRLVTPLLLAALVSLQIAAFAALMQASGGEPLYRVDHPSFLYRLWSWGQAAPRFIYYDPYWNGGKVMPYLVASGVLAPGFLLWPVWRFLDVTRTYTPALGVLFLLLVPAIAALSARVVTRSRLAWVAAALLSLGTSQFTFIHLVHYGTFGSLLAAAFLLPFSACLYRLLVQQRRDARTWAGLSVSLAGVLCWPPCALMALPFGVMLLVNRKRVTPRLLLGGVLLVGGMLLLFALPALSILTHSNVGGFTRSAAGLRPGAFLVEGGTQLAELLRRTQPVLLFAGGLGLLALPLRRTRAFFLPVLAVSLLAAAFGKAWKPTLQLDRMWINALYVAILPASLVIASLWRRTAFRAARPLAALLCGLLVTGGYTAVKYFGNEGLATYKTMSDEMREITAWMRAQVPPGGRVLFAGAAVHGYGGGKVASLPIYTGREMMACDYYGFSPKLVEYNYPPAEFRKHGPEKMFQFMDWYNVTHVITYHDYLKDYLRKYTDSYEEVWTATASPKAIFRVKREPAIVQEGEGRVEAGINRLDVYPADPSAPLVIRYNWVDGLSCEPGGAEIEAYETGTSVRLIRVYPNGAERVRIRYGRWY